ncbi:MAG: YlxR family protein [Coriobacteriia bacterium]|nr:YlxR family protein [Coriobacteriia bacterium]
MNAAPADTANTTKLSQRTCVACRKKAARTELLRFVQGSEGQVEFDQSRRAPGRGAWTCSSAQCFETAVAKGRFARVTGRRDTRDEEAMHKLRERVETYVNVAK